MANIFSSLFPTSDPTRPNSLTTFYLFLVVFGNFLQFPRAFHAKLSESPPQFSPRLTNKRIKRFKPSFAFHYPNEKQRNEAVSPVAALLVFALQSVFLAPRPGRLFPQGRRPAGRWSSEFVKPVPPRVPSLTAGHF